MEVVKTVLAMLAFALVNGRNALSSDNWVCDKFDVFSGWETTDDWYLSGDIIYPDIAEKSGSYLWTDVSSKLATVKTFEVNSTTSIYFDYVLSYQSKDVLELHFDSDGSTDTLIKSFKGDATFVWKSFSSSKCKLLSGNFCCGSKTDTCQGIFYFTVTLSSVSTVAIDNFAINQYTCAQLPAPTEPITSTKKSIIPVTSVAANTTPVPETSATANTTPVTDTSAAANTTPVPDTSAAANTTPVPDTSAAANTTPVPDTSAAANTTPVPETSAAANKTPVSDTSAAADTTPAPDTSAAANTTPVPDPSAAANTTPVPVTSAAANTTPVPVTRTAADTTIVPDSSSVTEVTTTKRRPCNRRQKRKSSKKHLVNKTKFKQNP